MTAVQTPAPTPLAALSHEFRTPLNAVLGMARLLESTRLTAEQKAYVAALKESGDHLLALVGDVLDLARLDAGTLTLNPAPMRIEALLQSVAELLSPRAHEKGLEIAWAAPAGLPPILADEGRLKQVLFNLAGNAIKFTDAGGVLLGCEAAPAAGALRLRLTVRDTGRGVAPDRQTTIFDAFTQGDERDRARADSTGLGLAIVRRLAAAHGGAVGVDSSPGEGSIFWFEADFQPAGKAETVRPLAGVTVIIASPSSILRQAAIRQIESAGGEPIACATREEAIRRASPGAVVLIDQALAGPRGRLRPVPGHPSLILLPPEARRRISSCRAAGFAGYLIKPLRQTSISERVLAVLGREASGAADERADPGAARGARVLLVEDNPINALLARKLLEREGCAVDLAASAEDALRAAGAMAYDLVLMDRRLPGLDGIEATRRLRALGVTAPIVALTADAFEEDRLACLAAGMDEFLTKPLDPHALRALLGRVLSDGWTNAQGNAKLAS